MILTISRQIMLRSPRERAYTRRKVKLRKLVSSCSSEYISIKRMVTRTCPTDNSFSPLEKGKVLDLRSLRTRIAQGPQALPLPRPSWCKNLVGKSDASLRGYYPT